ncbi:related to mitochondrial genome maintenance protein MGM101 [Ramularia collo-cygni]|uniref:Mitochondrial genome maintenance protein MGM101 n=1 Tax=Ramularia collo-cygni TaxID=112498 RepID=A0A2D3URL8_9PEZI|nr:related to mitochondrial genome maintenance protein MGM101 [Ramularia collo-cygni]CZT16195.1 related to mitochondrial genome maintenance protein MGM101 [Ramularia collo-cygni]
MALPRRAGVSLAAFISAPLYRRSATRFLAIRNASSAPPSPPPATAAANTAQVAHDLSPSDESQPLRSLTDGLEDPPPVLDEHEKQVDWTRSYHGLSASPFTAEQAQILQAPLDYDDIEIKPDGIVYLPEIKYRRVLNRAFGPGGWGLAPRGETIVTAKVVTREYGLVCGGRLVSIARGEQQYFDPDGIPTATEGCKSNALMRCCKDLGIASELWDPRFLKKFLAASGKETFVEHQVTKKRRKHWMRKDDEVKYPFKDVGMQGSNGSSGTAQVASKANAAKSGGTGIPAKANSAAVFAAAKAKAAATAAAKE